MIGYIHSPRECVTILGKPLQSYSQNELARQMAFLPQVPNMPKDMTVEEIGILWTLSIPNVVEEYGQRGPRNR